MCYGSTMIQKNTLAKSKGKETKIEILYVNTQLNISDQLHREVKQALTER